MAKQRKSGRKGAGRSRASVGGSCAVPNAVIVVDKNQGVYLPGPIQVYPNGIVLWVLTNDFKGADAEVTIGPFTDSNNKPAKPIKFKSNKAKVAKDGGIEVVIGRVTHKPARDGSDWFKYDVTIDDGKEKKYDPDLEVKPPPDNPPPVKRPRRRHKGAGASKKSAKS